MSNGVFSRLYDSTSYTGMYAERFAPEQPDSEEEAAHAFELRPSMNLRIQARERLATSPRSKRPTLKKNASVEERLQFLFQTYCMQGHGHDKVGKPMLESRNFIKMMQECPGLVDGDTVSVAVLDIVFVQCKAKTERRMTYDQFLLALSQLSLKAFPADAGVPRTAFTLLLANFLLRNRKLQGAAEAAGERSQPRVTFKFTDCAATSAATSTASSPKAGGGAGRGARLSGRMTTPFAPRRTITAQAVDDGRYGGGGDDGDSGSDADFDARCTTDGDGDGDGEAGGYGYGDGGNHNCGDGGDDDVANVPGDAREDLARALADTAAKSPLVALSTRQHGFARSPAAVALPAPSQELALQPRYDPPPALGYVIGNPAAQLKLGLFIDLGCAHSKRAFETLVGGVYKDIEDESPGLLSITLHNWVSPWTRGSLEVNEAALAVFDAVPEHFLGFCSEVFNAHFETVIRGDSDPRSMTSAQVTERALAIAVDRVGIEPRVLAGLRDPDSAESVRANKQLRLVTMLAVQTGVKRSPTATINGLVDNASSWDWSVEDWKEHISHLRG